jgi:hypothetical protein
VFGACAVRDHRWRGAGMACILGNTPLAGRLPVNRYRVDINTSLTRDDAWNMAVAFLAAQGFQYVAYDPGAVGPFMDDKTPEQVWKWQQDNRFFPRYVKLIPYDDRVHIESWVADVRLRGFTQHDYTGEEDLAPRLGTSGSAPALRAVVSELVRILTSSASEGRAAPAPPATPQGWYPDPYSAKHVRWWDGVRWTENSQKAR